MIPPTTSITPLDPQLQYGALGLLGLVVLVGMGIVYYLARALVSTLSSLSVGMMAMREALATTSATLQAMRHALEAAIEECRDSLLEVESALRSGRCRYRDDSDPPPE